MSRIIAVLSRKIAVHRRIIAVTLLKKIARHIAVYRCLSQYIAVMSSQRCREIAVKTTVANATHKQRLSAVPCCVRVVMSRLGDCRV